MALVVLLRGVNVGGHRTFRPSALAKELSAYDVVNIGAAGTFVVRKPGPAAKFQAALRKKLPFETEIVLCEGVDFARLVTDDPFRDEPARPDIVRFVSVLARDGRSRKPLPVGFPEGEWLVRVLGCRKRFAFGMYRRHMKTISYLAQVDKLFDVPVTTRNWNTVAAIVKVLSAEPPKRVKSGK